MGSLSHCDRESKPRWSIFSLSSTAAGGVGAVFCAADSIAGEEPSSGFSGFVHVTTFNSYIRNSSTLIPQAYHLSLKSRAADTSISGLSHTRLFLSSFSQVKRFNRSLKVFTASSSLG